MVVDDYHVGSQRLPPRRHHETIAILCAGLAQAVFARRGREAPRGCILRYLPEFALVSAAADAREARDTLQVSGVLAALHLPLREVALQIIAANVVGASLEQGRGHR